jgi:hypothetical protein
VSKKVRVGTGQYFKWMKGFTTQKRKRIGINLISATVGQLKTAVLNLNGMQNNREHRLSSACLVVPFCLQ